MLSSSSSTSSTSFFKTLEIKTTSSSYEEIDIHSFIENQKLLHNLLRAKNLLKTFTAKEKKYESLLKRIDEQTNLLEFTILAHGNFLQMKIDAESGEDSSKRSNARSHLKTLSKYTKSRHDYLKPITELNQETIAAIGAEPLFRINPKAPLGLENPIRPEIMNYLNPARISKITIEELNLYLEIIFFGWEEDREENNILQRKLFSIEHQENAYAVICLDDSLTMRDKFLYDYYIITLDAYGRPVAISSILKQPRNMPDIDPHYGPNIEEKLTLFPLHPYWIAYQPLSYCNNSPDLDVDFQVNSNVLQLYQIKMDLSGKWTFQSLGKPLYFPRFERGIKRLTLENDSRLFFIAINNYDVRSGDFFQIIEIQTSRESIQLVPHFLFSPKQTWPDSYQIFQGMFASTRVTHANNSFSLENIASGKLSSCNLTTQVKHFDSLILKYSSDHKKIDINHIKGYNIGQCDIPKETLPYDVKLLPSHVQFSQNIHKLISEYYEADELSLLLNLPRELQTICQAITHLFLGASSLQQALKQCSNLEDYRGVYSYNGNWEIRTGDFLEITHIFTTLHTEILHNPARFVTHVEKARKEIDLFVKFDLDTLPLKLLNTSIHYPIEEYYKVKEFFLFTLDPLVNRYRNNIPLLLHEQNNLEIELLTRLHGGNLSHIFGLISYVNKEALCNCLCYARYKSLLLREVDSKRLQTIINSMIVFLKIDEFAWDVINVFINGFDKNGFLFNYIASIPNAYAIAENLQNEIQAIKPYLCPVEEGKRLFTSSRPYREALKSCLRGSKKDCLSEFKFSSIPSSVLPVVAPDASHLQNMFNNMLQSKQQFPEDKLMDQFKITLIIEILKTEGVLTADGIKIKIVPDDENEKQYLEMRLLLNKDFLFSAAQRKWIEEQGCLHKETAPCVHAPRTN